VTNEKDYMPTETGFAQGAQGDQVERLQDYLRRYGYIESRVPEAFGMETVPGFAAPAPEESGLFDENTATALRRFQEFNNLPVTGELDQATVSLMGQSRCGVPDSAEFANTGRRWPTTNLTYAFQEFTPDLTQARSSRRSSRPSPSGAPRQLCASGGLR
jgi:peptidoglycan hydrolase-like protein with peptidoglycan-binding domain